MECQYFLVVMKFNFFALQDFYICVIDEIDSIQVHELDWVIKG